MDNKPTPGEIVIMASGVVALIFSFLDFYDTDDAVTPQHYCFLVGEDEFDQIFGRIKAQGLPYWADPGHDIPGEINTHDGGRGVYFDDPSGHILEIITRPYGEERC